MLGDASGPGFADGSEPGFADAAEPSAADASGPGFADGSEPGFADAAEPNAADASRPGFADGSEPGFADAAEPNAADASWPGFADGSEPGFADAAEPNAADASTQPDASSPADAQSEGDDAALLPDAGLDDTDATTPSPVLVVSAASSLGHLWIRASDAESDTPLNATIAYGDPASTTTTDSNGEVDLWVAPGRWTVTVSAIGYLPITREVGIVGTPGREEFPLIAQSSSQTVGAAGATISAGAAEIEVPAGAFAEDTSIAATWIESEHIASMPGTPLFFDSQGNTIAIRGVLDVATSTEPATPVTVRAAVPPDVDEPSLALYSLAADGTWIDPVSPSSIASGVASFAVDHFSAKGLGTARLGAVSSLLQVSGDVSFEVTDASGATTTRAFKRGEDIVEDGTLTVVTGGCGLAVIRGADGTETHVAPNTRVRIEPKVNKTSVLSLAYGALRNLVMKIDGGERLKIKTPWIASGVRGTDVATSTTHDRTDVEVSSGSVAVDYNGQQTLLTAGSSATNCPTCSPFQSCSASSCSGAGVPTCCGDSCMGRLCARPADYCSDALSLVAYSRGQGSCANGSCSYSPVGVDCGTEVTNGICRNDGTGGHCADACEGVVCTDPPAYCTDARTVRQWHAVCSSGTCGNASYDETSCPSAIPNGLCRVGASGSAECYDACEGVVCTDPPAYCTDARTVRQWHAVCSSGTCGNASYDETVCDGSLVCRDLGQGATCSAP